MIYYFDLFPGIRDTLRERAEVKLTESMFKVLPKKEVPKHAQPKTITDVKMVSDGTIRTYVEGEKYPVRFYTRTDAVSLMSIIKRPFSLMLGSGLGIVVLFIGRKIWANWLKFVFETNSLLLKDKHWSQPVKEVRRVLKGKLDDNFIDMIALTLQTDMAYCYRMQDVLGELNYGLFKLNPMKEIKRLLNLYEERELLDKNKNIIRKIKRYVWLLRIYGLNTVKKIVEDLKTKEIKFTAEDIYWTNIQEGYSFRGLTLAQRKLLVEK